MDAISLEDANVLAQCVRAMSGEDLRVFGAVLEVEGPRSFHEAGTIAMDIYDYELVTGIEREYTITALGTQARAMRFWNCWRVSPILTPWAVLKWRRMVCGKPPSAPSNASAPPGPNRIRRSVRRCAE